MNKIQHIIIRCVLKSVAGLEQAQRCNSCSLTEQLCERLGNYEEAEDKGLLLKLKAKVGDTVWINNLGHTLPYTITGYSYGTAEDYIDEPLRENEVIYYYKNASGSMNGSFVESLFGKEVFLDEEEALQQSKGEQDE